MTTTTAVITETGTTETTTVNEAVAVIQENAEKASTFFTQASRYFRKAVPLLIFAAIIIIIGLLLSKLIIRLIGRGLKGSKIDNAAKHFLLSVIKIFLYMIVIIMALSVLNVPMSSVIAVFGAAGLAVSLALQNCLTNLCGGFIILFSKPFAAGDIIEFDGVIGRVDTISILYTKVFTYDGKTVFIPNGKISDAKIINFTESPSRRIELNFGISYSSDFKKAREAILKVLANDTLLLKNPEPIVRMSAHSESSINIDVLVWVPNDDYFTARYNIIEGVKTEFDRNGIEIPFNQMDVHIIPPVSDAGSEGKIR